VVQTVLKALGTHSRALSALSSHTNGAGITKFLDIKPSYRISNLFPARELRLVPEGCAGSMIEEQM